MEEYEHYRDLASEVARKRAKYFEESKAAYERGDKAQAHELSTLGKQCSVELEKYNRQAAAAIYRYKNTQCQPDEIDLHGLYVDEAVQAVEQRIQNCYKFGFDHLHIIVGKGTHSANHVEKLRPAVLQKLQELSLRFQSEENAGRILVHIPVTVPSAPVSVPPQVPQVPQVPVAAGAGAAPVAAQQQQQQQPAGTGAENIAEEVVSCCLPSLKSLCTIM
ncbi:SMR and DUF1771 domain-containing protein [Schizosaccharomyces japonicus yFS275]|uniref:SMR and DUF1771 domain-containing protein n=1 Tax=Schizosaccharomyces japonicus (strain yFS275 / FY16936) TaxID=402676 RepID=B6JZE3_SCHJY|nr:SMR and DUF1771 domain-containing protein [Schizosaccharomyces japonicus yFS275]EEB06911.2 SMR and DUF1771 domain-containing protein [Schizosaccharomyces japonicus yFS275]